MSIVSDNGHLDVLEMDFYGIDYTKLEEVSLPLEIVDQSEDQTNVVTGDAEGDDNLEKSLDLEQTI